MLLPLPQQLPGGPALRGLPALPCGQSWGTYICPPPLVVPAKLLPRLLPQLADNCCSASQPPKEPLAAGSAELSAELLAAAAAMLQGGSASPASSGMVARRLEPCSASPPQTPWLGASSGSHAPGPAALAGKSLTTGCTQAHLFGHQRRGGQASLQLLRLLDAPAADRWHVTCAAALAPRKYAAAARRTWSPLPAESALQLLHL